MVVEIPEIQIPIAKLLNCEVKKWKKVNFSMP
jgi:hypothetical protein